MKVVFVFGRNFEVNGEYPEKLKRMGISVPAVEEGRGYGFYRQRAAF